MLPLAVSAAVEIDGIYYNLNSDAKTAEVTFCTNRTAERYHTIDGKQLSTPQRGLNIVKMSDGTTRKVIVK